MRENYFKWFVPIVCLCLFLISQFLQESVARVRDNMVNIAATKISAGVSTGIGEHVKDVESKGMSNLKYLMDVLLREVYNTLLKNNLQPVMSDSIYVS